MVRLNTFIFESFIEFFSKISIANSNYSIKDYDS